MENSQGYVEEELPLIFAKRVGINFTNIGLLTRALTHRSYLNEHKSVLEDNERLEFLGDAVLDFLVGAWLYNRFPEMAEGQLTRFRAALVGNHQLAEFARKIDLGSALRLGKGEADSGGRERSTLLGSAFEALIGSLYLDQGISVVNQFLEPFLEDAVIGILSARRDQDPKSKLQEWSQAQGYGTPTYRTVSAVGPDHDKIFEVEVSINGHVYGMGRGSSKQIAAKISAQIALESLELE
jgi:ribonuclease III